MKIEAHVKMLQALDEAIRFNDLEDDGALDEAIRHDSHPMIASVVPPLGVANITNHAAAMPALLELHIT